MFSTTAQPLLRSVVAPLQASEPAPVSGVDAQKAPLALNETALGYATATPEFPFDVLTGATVFAKSTLLVVDVDSVVQECVRVLRWCAVGPHAEVDGAKDNPVAEVGSVGTANRKVRCPVRTPTLERLLCCFLQLLRDIVKKQRTQVELILGNCEAALADLAVFSPAAVCGDTSGLQTARCDAAAALEGVSHSCDEEAGQRIVVSAPPPCVAASALCDVEGGHVWLQIYQTIVLFFRGGGSDVVEHTAFYTTTKPAWTLATARVRRHCSEPLAQNAQVFPLLWSTDARAYFAAAGNDALLSSWLTFCRHEVARLCGHPLPAQFLHAYEASPAATATHRSGAAGAVSAEEVLEMRVLVRHGASVAQRLGLHSAAYLPAMYAILTLDAVHEISGTPQECVARAARLVNHHLGLLYTDVVQQWMEETAASRAALSATAPSLHLATAVWAAQASLRDVTAADVAFDRHMWTIWVSKTWNWRGIPPVWCVLGCPTAAPFISADAGAMEAGTKEETELPAARGTSFHFSHIPSSLRDVHRELESLRTETLDALHRIFRDGPGCDLNRRLSESSGGAVQANTILADWYTARRNAVTTATPPEQPAAFQTRPSLDAIRTDVRPAAQLTVVALSLLWTRRLWCERDCLRLLVFFLVFLDAQTGGEDRVLGTAALSLPAAAVGPSTGEAGAAPDSPCGLRKSEVEAWWHALSCVTVLQSLSAVALASSQFHSPATLADEMVCSAASVFTGCLAAARYGPADKLSFLSFLERSGLLLPDCCADGESMGACAAAEENRATDSQLQLSVCSIEEVTDLRRRLRCPATLTNEVVLAHDIWANLKDSI